MSSNIKPLYEDKYVYNLYNKLIKYMVMPRYRDIVYFFLMPKDSFRTITAMTREKHLILVEAIGEINNGILDELTELYGADLIEFLRTPMGSKLLNRLSFETLMGPNILQSIDQIQGLMREIPEFQEVLNEISTSGIPITLPLSLYRSSIIATARIIYSIYVNQLFLEKIPSIINILSREYLIEPIYQIEICYRSDCRYIKTSVPADPFIIRRHRCPKCGSSILVFKVYAVDNVLSKLKYNRGIDLPILIREYLRFRSYGSLKVYGPCMYGDSELDVVLPNSRIGIECKLFKNTRFTEHDALSQAGKIGKELNKYWDASLDKVYIITNLSVRGVELLEEKLHQYIPCEKKVKVVAGDVEMLISTLDSLVQ